MSTTRTMPWFRMYSEAVDDEKLRLLAFEDRWHFVALLCCKGSGILDADDSDELMRRKLAVKLGLDMRAFDEAMRRIAEVGLIDRETLQPVNWSKRQHQSDTSAERTRRYRENKKKAGDADVTDGDVTVTSPTRHSDALDTDTDTDTEKDKEEKKESIPRGARVPTLSVSDLVSHGVDEQVAAEFLAVRKSKRAPLTQIAFDGLVREAGKAKLTLDAALRQCIERGWQSFDAKWVPAKTAGQPSRADHNAQWNAKMNEMLAQTLGTQTPEIIDMGAIDASR